MGSNMCYTNQYCQSDFRRDLVPSWSPLRSTGDTKPLLEYLLGAAIDPLNVQPGLEPRLYIAFRICTDFLA